MVEKLILIWYTRVVIVIRWLRCVLFPRGRPGGFWGIGRRAAVQGAVCLALLLALSGVNALASAPPGDQYPAPGISSSKQITDPLEAQTLITNTTTSGALWIIERRFTYGEASIVIVLLALCLLTIFDILLRLAVLKL